MTSRKRIISLILASMMLLSAASCSESGTNDETTTQTAGENTEAAAPETIPEETGPVAELPDKTYDGEEVMFLTSLNLGYDWYTSYEIYAEEMNGQLFNDAVAARRREFDRTVGVPTSGHSRLATRPKRAAEQNNPSTHHQRREPPNPADRVSSRMRLQGKKHPLTHRQ